MLMLKRARMVKGLTLQEVAKRIGVSPATCSNWETGSSIPYPRHRKKLCRVLGINYTAFISQLLQDEESLVTT